MAEICRLCRKIDCGFSESINSYQEGLKISEMIMKVCLIKISESDQLPKVICEECLEVS